MSKERDPIERIRKLILAHDLAPASDLKDIEKEVRKQVDEAIAQAKESPMLDPSELFTNVYVKDWSDHHLQDTHLQSYLHPFISIEVQRERLFLGCWRSWYKLKTQFNPDNIFQCLSLHPPLKATMPPLQSPLRHSHVYRMAAVTAKGKEGWQALQNLQMHLRRHKVPWKLRKRDSEDEKQRLGVPVLGCCNSSILCRCWVDTLKSLLRTRDFLIQFVHNTSM